MQLKIKTLLNLKEHYSGFVFQDVRLNTKNNNQRIEIKVEARKGSQGVCSGCGEKCPGYDRLAQREFLHVPLWGIRSFFILHETFTVPHVRDHCRICTLGLW